MKARLERFYIFVVILCFVLAGCTFQEAPMEYGIVVQLDREWRPKNLLEYPFTHWTYMFKPDGKKAIPPRKFGITLLWTSKFSPDGKWLVYQDYWNDQIYLMRVSDGKRVKATNSLEEMSISAIKWLGDGHTIAYGRSTVYIQDVGCLLTTKKASSCLPSPTVVELGANTSFDDISPDGRKIIYTYEYGAYKFDMYLLDINNQSRTILKNATQVTFINDVAVLVSFSNDETLYTAEISADGLTNQKVIAIMEKGDGGFLLSPDGRYIAFTSIAREGLGSEMNPYAPVESHPFTSALFVLDTVTSEVRRLTYPNDHTVIWYDWYPLR